MHVCTCVFMHAYKRNEISYHLDQSNVSSAEIYICTIIANVKITAKLGLTYLHMCINLIDLYCHTSMGSNILVLVF